MGGAWLSPAEWDSEPGRGCGVPAARRRCSPLTTRRWPSHSAGSPSAPPAPCSTASPPPGSCDVTGRAPPPAPGQNHRSGQKHFVLVRQQKAGRHDVLAVLCCVTSTSKGLIKGLHNSGVTGLDYLSLWSSNGT